MHTPIVAETLKSDNLKVNQSKTEHTTIRREKQRIDEKWRTVKKLGSLLGDSEDVIRRKQLSYTAMNKIKPMWKGRKKVSIQTMKYINQVKLGLSLMK